MKKNIQILIKDFESPHSSNEPDIVSPDDLIEEKNPIIQVEGKEYGTDLSYKYIEKYDSLKKIEAGIPLSNYLKDYKKRDLSVEFQVI